MSPVYGYVFNLFLVLVLVFCNAFFVVSEFAIVKIRRTKLEELAHAGSKRAKIALKINEHMNTNLPFPGFWKTFSQAFLPTTKSCSIL